MKSGLFIAVKDLTPFPIVEGVIGRSAWGQHIMLTFVEHEANHKHGTHTHTFEQAGIMLQGQKYIQMGNETRLLRPGDAYIVPAGVEHGSHTTDSSSVNMDIFTPPRDDYKH